jgi:hypothetical protein
MKITRDNNEAVTLSVEFSGKERKAFVKEFEAYDTQEDWSIRDYDILKECLLQLWQELER